jgi:hypothetical protein
MAEEERYLWYDFLKSLPIMVHHQKIIGRYIVDFHIAEVKLVIELTALSIMNRKTIIWFYHLRIRPHSGAPFPEGEDF